MAHPIRRRVRPRPARRPSPRRRSSRRARRAIVRQVVEHSAGGEPEVDGGACIVPIDGVHVVADSRCRGVDPDNRDRQTSLVKPRLRRSEVAATNVTAASRGPYARAVCTRPSAGMRTNGSLVWRKRPQIFQRGLTVLDHVRRQRPRGIRGTTGWIAGRVGFTMYTGAFTGETVASATAARNDNWEEE